MKKAKQFIIRQFITDAIVCIIIALFILFITSSCVEAQSIGINNPTPHAKSLLDLTSTDKGLLAPRLTQVQRLAMFPSADATASGMLVYQTDNTKGFYYYDGAVWILISNANSSWGLTGNTGTAASTNFIGTTDNQDVVFKSNNAETMRLKSNQKVGFGTNNPGLGYASARIEIADETGTNSDLAMRTAATGHPEIVLESSGGTLAAPTVSPSGAWGGVILGQVYDGTQFTNTSALIFGTEGINTVGNVAGTIQFNTNKWGALGWEKMRISSIGNLGVGVANPLNRADIAGNVNVMLDSNYRINNVRVLSTKGTSNYFSGSNAGINNLTGGYNTFVGYNSGYTNTTGGSNAFFGQVSGGYNTTGTFNTFLGNVAGLHNITGSTNTYVGSHTGFNGTTGAYNVFVGNYAGYNNSDTSNIFIGVSSGYANVVGKYNVFCGNWSGANATGSDNTFYGYSSGYHTNTGNFNAFFGEWSGNGNTTGSKNSYFGYLASGAGNISNSGAFGHKAYVALSNSIVLGDTGVNIGINMAAPLYPLSFRNTLGDKISFWGGAGNHYGIGVQGYLLQIHTAAVTDDIAFGYGCSANLNEKMRIKGNGKVGIGTSTPGNLFTTAGLEIADSTGVNKDLMMRSSNNANYQQVIAFARTRGTFSSPTIVQVNDNIGRLSGTGYDGANLLTASEIQYHIDSTASLGNMPGNITFHTNAGNSNSFCAERMRIDHSGNVGIGTGNPTAKLEVAGQLKITGGSPAAGKVLSSDATGLASWNTVTSIAWGLNGNTATNVATDFIGTTDAVNLNFRTGNLQRLTISSNGNVGIGTSAPQTQLEINGALTVKEDATLTANAATFTITVGNRTYFRINSNAAPASRIIALSNGLQVGQILILECAASGGVNGIRMADTPATNNTNLTTFHDMYENDVITLLWNGTDWIEMSYANN